MKRRNFLQALMAGSTAAVAAHFGVAAYMVPEIKEELAKSLATPHVSMSGLTPFEGNNAIWWSVGGVAQVWAEQLNKQHNAVNKRPLNQLFLTRACQRMAKAIDIDAMKAELPSDQKVLVNVPKLRLTGLDAKVLDPAEFMMRRPTVEHFDLVAGLDTKAGLWGQKYEVGYIPEKIFTGETIDESKRIWTGRS